MNVSLFQIARLTLFQIWPFILQSLPVSRIAIDRVRRPSPGSIALPRRRMSYLGVSFILSIFHNLYRRVFFLVNGALGRIARQLADREDRLGSGDFEIS